MSFQLGASTIPRPKTIERDQEEIGSKHTHLTGKSTKDIYRQKETFVFTYDYLSPTDRGNIMAEYQSKASKSLIINEPDLSVNTTVLITIPKRKYDKGGYNNESLTIILEEV